MEPLVSVVIPTADRPQRAAGAARSALCQSLEALEVIVVVDGPDPRTLEELRRVEDPRLRVVSLATRLGPGGARNAGAREARGEWVAFLDDDDRWDPGKLEAQIATARSSPHRYPIVTCRLIARDGEGEAVFPRRLPRAGEPLSEYLLAREGLFWGETLVHTSTILTRTDLLDEVAFRPGLDAHEDWDWLLRAAALDGAGVVFVPGPGPLAVWSTDEGRPRTSTGVDWRASLEWAHGARGLLTPRAYAAFLLTVVSAYAAADRGVGALWSLPWEATRRGSPRPLDFALHLGIWVIPRRLRARLARLRGRGVSPW